MKAFWLSLLALLCLLPFVSAEVIMNLTFDTKDGFYNTSDAENLAVGENFKVMTAFYNLSGRGYEGYYNCLSNRYLNATGNFRTISADALELSAFAMVRSGTVTGTLVSQYNVDSQRGWSLELDGAKVKVLLSQAGTAANKSYTSTEVLGGHIWYFVGFTYKNNVLNLYVNGLNQTSVTKTTDHPITTIHASARQPMICARGNGPPAGMPVVSIDNVLVFNETLSPTEVLALYNSIKAQYGPLNLFFSNSGSDSNDCFTAACKTLTKHNTITKLPGDNISFERGDIFRAGDDAFLTFNSGSSGNYNTYKSYGTGAPPILTGSSVKTGVGNWTDKGGNKWESTDVSVHDLDVGNLYMNSLYNPIIGFRKPYLANLSAQGHFWYNSTNDTVVLYSVGNPGTVYSSIDFALKKAVINGDGKSYLRFQDLDTKFTGKGVFEFGEFGTSHHIDVLNNNVSFWGGSYQNAAFLRYGNGIGFSLTTYEVNVIGNYVHDGWDACLSPQAWGTAGVKRIINHTWAYNIVTACPYGFEYFNTNTSSTTGNITVEHNTFYNIDTGWPRKQFVNRGRDLRLANTPASTTDVVFRNNIFYNSSLYTIDLGNNNPNWRGPIYMDYNLYVSGASNTPYLWNGTSYASFTLWKTATGKESHGLESDPLFVDVASDDVRPYADSPACTMSDSGGFVGALACAPDDTPVTPLEPVEEFASGMNDTLGIVVSMFALIVIIVILGVVLVLFAGGRIDGEQFTALVLILMTTGILCGVGVLLFSALGAI